MKDCFDLRSKLEHMVNDYTSSMWDSEIQEYHFTHDQLETLLNKLVEAIGENTDKNYVDRVSHEATRIALEKCELRSALLEAGFSIPERKHLKDWISYIKERDRR